MAKPPPEAGGRPRLIFLGTGAAWRVPELGCPCAVCTEMRARGESRTRTALWLEAPAKVLVDCGPDIASQLETCGLDRPEVVLLTHEHGDHFLGLDELEAFRRREPAGSFPPIPTYATAETWEIVAARFGYLTGKLLDKRLAVPGRPLSGLEDKGLQVTPFKTDHGPGPRGAVGYIFEFPARGRTRKLVYTSDFKDVPQPLPLLNQPDVLVLQAHWFNEPRENRPSHLSLQRGLDFIRRWQPQEHVFLVHLSGADLCPGEKEGAYLKKQPPRDPLGDPATGRPFPVPRSQAEWQRAAVRVFAAHGLEVAVTVAYDGLKVEL